MFCESENLLFKLYLDWLAGTFCSSSSGITIRLMFSLGWVGGLVLDLAACERSFRSPIKLRLQPIANMNSITGASKKAAILPRFLLGCGLLICVPQHSCYSFFNIVFMNLKYRIEAFRGRVRGALGL